MINSLGTVSRQLRAATVSFFVVGLITAVPISANTSHAGEQLLSGTFFGQSDHVTTGKITIEKDGDRTIVILHSDFSLDGAPSPTVGFSKDGKFDVSTEFAKLKSLNGAQRYEVPKNIAVRAYDAFTVWCSKFAVPLGSAKLG